MDTREVATVLRRRRDDLAAELGVITIVERDPDASVSFGKRVGDGTTEAVERLNRVGTARELDAMLRDVDRALAKLEDGTYGICDRCGKLDPGGTPRGAPLVGPVRRVRRASVLSVRRMARVTIERAVKELAARAPGAGVFLDLDGTLAPIVPRPELARLLPELRASSLDGSRSDSRSSR